MKKLYSILLVFLGSMSLMAQTPLVVTLTHDGTTTNYEGLDAFKNAVAASADGDLITLSAGTFNGTTIDKSLNIRGNGVGPENATIISTKTILKHSADEDEANHWLNIEGVSFTGEINLTQPSNTTDLNVLKDLTMKKCDIANFSSERFYPDRLYYGTTKNASFIQCRITNSITLFNVSEAAFINSIVFHPDFNGGNGGQENNPKINFENSVVITDQLPWNFLQSNSLNSIILQNITEARRKTGQWTSESNFPFPATVGMDHCIISGYLVDPGTNTTEMLNNSNITNTQWKPMAEVFSTLEAYTTYDSTNDYSLTDAAKEILGTNNTQLGIYGGFAPYSNIVSYPRFGTFNVAEKAENGVLSVDITVE